MADNFKILIDDNFTASNTTVGPAGSTSGAGNNFTDIAGGIASISGNQLKLLGSGSTAYNTDYVLRPVGEGNAVGLNGELTLDLPAISPGTFQHARFFGVLRKQTGTSETYLVAIFFGGNGTAGASQFKLYYISPTNAPSPLYTFNFTFDSTATYTMDVQLTGGAAPVFNGSLKANGSVVTYGSGSAVIPSITPGFIIANAGRWGFTYADDGTPTTQYYTRFRLYYDNTTANASMVVSVGPGSFPYNRANPYALTNLTQNLTLTGTNTNFTTFTLYGGTGASITPVGPPSATSAILSFNPGTASDSIVIVDNNTGAMLAINVQGPTLQLDTAKIAVSTADTLVNGYGTNVSWNTGLGTQPFTVTGVAGCSLISENASGTPPTQTVVLHIATGTTPGVLTVSDGGTPSATAQILVTQNASVTDTNIYFSPYNSYSDGGGVPQSNNVSASSAKVIWNAPGAYLSTKFTGPYAALLVDTTALAAQSAANYPTIAYSVDGGPLTYTQLTTGQTSVPLLSGGTTGTHTLFVQYATFVTGVDAWTTPIEAVVITGLQIAGTTVAPSRQPKNMAVFGDSISEGFKVGTVTGTTTVNDFTQSAVPAIAAALNAEYGAVAYASLGWTVDVASPPSGTGVPAFYSLYSGGNPNTSGHHSWDQFYSGAYRLYSNTAPVAGGVFAPSPDYIVVLLGTNDSNNAIGPSVTAWLALARAAAPNAYICIVPPYGANDGATPPGPIYAGPLIAGVQAYLSAHPTDTKVLYINIGQQPGLTFTPANTATAQSVDGKHPRGFENTRLASVVSDGILTAIAAIPAPLPPPTTPPFNRAGLRDAARRMLGITPPIDRGTGNTGDAPINQPDPSNAVLNQFLQFTTQQINQMVGYHSITTLAYAISAQAANGPLMVPFSSLGLGNAAVNDIRRLLWDDGSGNLIILNATSWADQDRQNYTVENIAPGTPYCYYVEGYNLFVSPAPSTAGTLRGYAGTGVVAPIIDTDYIEQLPFDFQQTVVLGMAVIWLQSQSQDAESQSLLQSLLPAYQMGVKAIADWKNSYNVKQQQSIGFASYRIGANRPAIRGN